MKKDVKSLKLSPESLWRQSKKVKSLVPTPLFLILLYTIIFTPTLFANITFVSSTSNASTGGNANFQNIEISLPSGVAENDVLIASIAFRPESSTIATPSGWTLLRIVPQPDSISSKLAIFYRIATASEQSSHSWEIRKSGGNSTNGIAGSISAFRGVDITTPIDVEGGQPTPNATSHATPSVATTTANTMLVSTHEYASSGTWIPPDGMTEAIDIRSASGASGIALSVNYQLQEAMGPTGNKIATASGYSDSGATHILALRPIQSTVPIAEYRFDECEWDGSNGEVIDQTGNHNGTSHNGASTDSEGKVCRSGYFDGTDDYVQIPQNNIFDSQKFTLSAWVKSDGGGANTSPNRNYIISKGAQGSTPYLSYGMFYDRNQNKFGCWINGSEHHSNTTTNNTSFDHFVCSYDGVALKFYLNGNPDGEITINKTINFLLADNSLYIGRYDAGGLKRYFKGYIDEVLVFNEVISQSQASEIYANQNAQRNWDNATDARGCQVCALSTIVDYRFDECEWNGTAGEVKDNSGNTRDAYKIAEANITKGEYINHSGVFDGIGDYVQFDDASFINGLSEITVMAWVKNTATLTGNDRGIFYTMNATDNDRVLGIRYDVQGSSGGGINVLKASVHTTACGTLSDCVQVETTNDAMKQNVWQHVTMTWKSGSGMRVYIDGVDVTGDGVGDMGQTVGGTIDGSTFLRIGYGAKSNGANDKDWKGNIDEFKIFDKQLSESQIQEIYSNENAKNNYDGTSRDTVTCSLPVCYTDDFNRVDLGSKWSIIKAYNFTPKIIDNKLVLTEDRNDIAAGVSLIGEFPSSDNLVEIEFEHNAYARTSGADGVAVVFSDANVTPVAGGFGGSLGYAPKGGIAGFTGAWLGFGIDEYGNFASDGDGNKGRGCISPYKNNSAVKDSLTIRGRGASNNLDGYCFIANSGGLTPGVDAVSAPNHKYKFLIDTRNNQTKITVQRDINDGNGYVTLPNMDEADATQTAVAPPNFKLSFTGSTGGSKNWHTFDNLTIRAIGCGTLGQDQDVANSFFDAWDNGGDLADRDIETKIVSQNFTLNIVGLNETNDDYQNFEGTVCARVSDTDIGGITNWQKLLFTGANLQTLSFNSDIASKDSRIEIMWKKDADEACPLINPDGTTSSTDNFAIRPSAFSIIQSGAIYAGEDFPLTFRALGNSGSPASNYNETIGLSFELSTSVGAGCVNGLLQLQNFSFEDGIKNVDASYSEVGDLNITISEISGSEFARVDFDDTSLANRLIPSYTRTLGINPYELNITDANFTASTNSDWLYMALLSDMNATIDLSVEAFNKQGVRLQNYDIGCYSRDVGISLDMSVANEEGSFSFNSEGFSFESGNGVALNGTNLSRDLTFPSTAFNNGLAQGLFIFNIDRQYNLPRNPNLITLNQATMPSFIHSLFANGMAIDDSKTFVYGRIRPLDTITVSNSVQTPVEIEVFNSGASDFTDGMFEQSLDWYRNSSHTNVAFGRILSGLASQPQGLLPMVSDNVTVMPGAIANGIQDLDLTATQPAPLQRTIHLQISPWLWYSTEGVDYNASVGSTCKTHPCLDFTYDDFTGRNAIESGGFGGLNFEVDDLDANSSAERRRGVKVFR